MSATHACRSCGTRYFEAQDCDWCWGFRAIALETINAGSAATTERGRADQAAPTGGAPRSRQRQEGGMAMEGVGTFRAMRHLWWRFHWADEWFSQPGLYFWAGSAVGNVRLWGTGFVLQLGILLLTLPGIWLAGGNGAEMRMGFVLLLASQPFWLAATWRARHFGAFAVAVLFTALWARAVLNSL